MIDMAKQYRTRDGREVRLLMTDGGGSGGSPVIGAIKDRDWSWFPCCWAANGWYHPLGGGSYDLIEVRPRIKREYWMNVYPSEMGNVTYLYLTKKVADKAADSDRIACVRVEIDVEEGEGL